MTTIWSLAVHGHRLSNDRMHCNRNGIITFDRCAVVNDDYVVVTVFEIRVPHVCRWREISSPAEAMNDQFCGMNRIVVCVVKGVWIEDVQLLRIVLGPPRIEVKVDLWMGATEGLLEARVTGV